MRRKSKRRNYIIIIYNQIERKKLNYLKKRKGTMSNELDTIKQELVKEKQLSNFYHHLYEKEHAKNEELHAALLDLRKKCEKWYNSTEMEEEMLVNKVRL